MTVALTQVASPRHHLHLKSETALVTFTVQNVPVHADPHIALEATVAAVKKTGEAIQAL